MTALKQTISTLVIALSLSSCNKGTSADATGDSSTSGVAASAVGGALSSSSGSGTQAMMNFKKPSLLNSFISEAIASGSCPTYKSTDSNCTASANSMWLNYAGCSFTGNVSWTGVQQLSMSSGSAVCGAFPNPGANGTLYRQFVSAVSSTGPASVNLSASVLSASIDNAATSGTLKNFDGAVIAPIVNGGYGSAVSFDGSGKRSSLVLGEHITLSGFYDHTITGALNIAEGNGQRTVSTSSPVRLYHNLLRVVGSSTFTNVIHTDMCCWPVGGSITTSFSAGANVAPTDAGLKLVGKSETLTFNGSCGSGSLTDATGAVTNVTFNRCF